MEKLFGSKSNNRGLSLVELIVAIAIAAIVSASIAGLIAYSVRMYHNENVNTAMQYEIQTNVNQVMDAIMSSSGLVIVQDASEGKTDYAGFGKFKETRNASNVVTKVAFTGIVLVSGSKDANGRFNVYMRRVDSAIEGTSAKAAVEEAAKPIRVPAEGADLRPYLLGMNCKNFKLDVDTDTSTSSCIVDGNKYTNPLCVGVELEFEKDGTGKVINKKVSDEAIMRNKVVVDISINNVTYALKK